MERRPDRELTGFACMNAEALNALILAELPRAQRGDQAAYGRIVAACQGGISAIALAMVRDVHSSEDIAQEAFIKAWTSLARLRNPSSFLPWLRQITRNLARDHLRGRRPDQSGADFDVVLATVADPTPDHDEQLARHDLIDELPAETREILLIYYREGQSSRQVATLLGLQDAAVRKRLSRARQYLREDLLVRLGEFARSSAPTAAFTAIVVAGLTMSAPAAAAGFAGGAVAASKGLGKLTVGAGAVLGKLLPKAGFAGSTGSRLMLGAAGGIVLVLVITVAALFIGLRRYWVTAIDSIEKRQLAVFAASGVGVIVLFSLAMGQAVYVESAVLPTISFVALIVVLGLMNILWLPRILARRHALEARFHPEVAAQARRVERRNAWLGMLIGVVLGSAGLAFGLLSSGRI
jgi:RNA polymerase sigma factor (sigma-70 family)